MKQLLSLALLLPLFACGAAVEPAEPQPAQIVGGFIDPPAELPASHSLTLSDGNVSYRVMFGLETGQGIADRINEFTSATIVASMTADGRLLLETVETGPGAHLEVVKGEALPMLGLESRPSADGR